MTPSINPSDPTVYAAALCRCSRIRSFSIRISTQPHNSISSILGTLPGVGYQLNNKDCRLPMLPWGSALLAAVVRYPESDLMGSLLVSPKGSDEGLYEPALADTEREAVADLLQYLENVRLSP